MFSVIILAAGQGTRTKLEYNKMLYQIDDETIIEKVIKPFYNNIHINQIVVVINKKDESQIKELLKDYNITYVYGGKERYNSVYCGLLKVANDYVLIHDGARCFITSDLITKLCDEIIVEKAAFLGVKAKDTIHFVEDGYVTMTTNRENTYLAQTPQGFETKLILDAYHQLMKDSNQEVTDDVMIFRNYLDYPIKLVESSYSNIKITTPEDL